MASSVEGSIYFVTVAMCADLALKDPQAVGHVHECQRRHPESVAIGKYRNALESLGAPMPYEFSAGLLIKPGQLDALHEVADFDLGSADALRRSASYLANVEAFAGASFIRMIEVRELDSGRAIQLSGAQPDDRAGPRYPLHRGMAYEIELFNYHPRPIVHPVRFQFTTSGDVVTFAGWAGFEIASLKLRQNAGAGRPTGVLSA